MNSTVPQGISCADRRLIQAHGGSISVESQLNEDTTFILYLPQ